MRHLALLTALLFSGCLNSVSEEPGDGGHDAGPSDGGLPDAGADAGLPDAGTDGGLLFGTVRPDCAPWDGPAFRFELSEQPLGCETSQSEGFYVSLWISPLAPGSYPLGPDYTQKGQACLCGVVADQAQAGSVMQLDSVTDAGVSGRIDATFNGGHQVHTPWQVIWCPGPVFCG